jgi:hypothetical protein
MELVEWCRTKPVEAPEMPDVEEKSSAISTGRNLPGHD